VKESFYEITEYVPERKIVVLASLFTAA